MKICKLDFLAKELNLKFPNNEPFVYLTLAIKSLDNKLTQERLGVVTLKASIGNLIENRKLIAVNLKKYPIILRPNTSSRR